VCCDCLPLPSPLSPGEDIGDEELRDMIDEADRDGDGLVTFDDFLRIQRKGGDPWASDDEEEGGGGGGPQ
jgi:hypothetical protein